MRTDGQFVRFPMSTRNVEIVNLTGHGIVLTDGVDSVRFDANGRARVDSRERLDEQVMVDGLCVPVLRVSESAVLLPEPRDGILYVVSGIVAAKARREDVVAPGRMERKRNGRIESARALIRIERET